MATEITAWAYAYQSRNNMHKMVGIEALNVFGCTDYLDVMGLVAHRQLDQTRFDNLLMKEKAVILPFEDPITYGVNAAKPLIDALSTEQKN